MIVICFKGVFQFIAGFPGNINKTEPPTTFSRNSLMVQNKFIKFLYLFMTRPVNPLYFLFQLLDIFNMYKVSGNCSIPVTSLRYNQQTNSFTRLILKVIGNFVNMMV